MAEVTLPYDDKAGDAPWKLIVFRRAEGRSAAYGFLTEQAARNGAEAYIRDDRNDAFAVMVAEADRG